MRPLAWIAALCCLIALAGPCPASAQSRVGGPCRYAVFAGKATIASVTPWRASPEMADAPTPYPPLAVTFTFAPDTPIIGEPLYQPDRPQTLTLVNGMPPGPQFAARYGIAAGRVLPCELHIIRQGTCTPALYVFPGIDRTDYFELSQP